MATHPLWRPYAPAAGAERQADRVARRQVDPGPLVRRADGWSEEYEALRRRILDAVPDQVRAVHHVGSTAVAGLLAKPVLDVDLTVPVVEDEAAYLPRLEVVGFRLVFRDVLGGDAHRQLTCGAPNANLHVWGPGAAEPQRHLLFLRWLRTSAEDRGRYEAAKQAAAQAAGGGGGAGVTGYNDAKAAVVHDIYERAFRADPDHPHDPRPRP